MMLTVNNISKSFGKFSALCDVSLEFGSGVCCLLAPNGAGKTTLIKMLATLIFPTAGEITYNGDEIVKLGGHYREKIGYLPQNFGFYKGNSPRQFLLYLAALKGIPEKEAKAKTDELLNLVGLSEVKNKKMRKFSGGMIQRVGIAQALLNDPEILILDEPTAGLDPKERVRFRNLITEVSRNKTVIFSTHIVSDVESIANRIVMLKDKKVFYDGNVTSVCKKLDGTVYETELPFEALPEFRKTYLTLAEKQEDGKMRVRFVTSEEPKAEWHSVTPGLEDAFLTIYSDDAGVQSDAQRAAV